MTAWSRRRNRPQGAEPSCRRRVGYRSAALLVLAPLKGVLYLLFFLTSLPAFAQQPGVETARAAAEKAFASGQYDEARTLAEAAPKDDSLIALRARTFIVRGDYAGAMALLQSVVAENPGGEAALELGLLQKSLGRRGEARRTLELLRLAQGPGTASRAFVRAGRAARAVGRFEEANSLFREATQDAPNDPVAATAWGELFLEKHDRREATKSFQAALKAKADYQPALLGMARAVRDENPPAASRFARHVLELNESNPDAYLLLAELAIDEDRRADAADAIARVKAINANSLEAHALTAALAFVEGREADYQAAVAAALAINPVYGEVYRVTGSTLASAYRFDEAVELTRKAILADRENARAQADLGAHLMRTGDEVNARRALQQAFRADPYDVVTYNLLGVLDKLEAFETVREGELVLKFHRDEAGVMREYAPALAREAMTALSERWEFTPKGPILIEMFPLHDDFAVRNVGLPGLIGALGACFGRVVTLDSPKARPPGEFNWGATLWHEMAHVITLQLSNQRIPRWLTEGISVFEETRAKREWGREMEMQFARALDEDAVLKLKDLNAAFQDPRTISLAYYEASLLVEHIVAAHGQPALKALVQSFAEGITTEEALRRVLKVEMDALQTSFDGFLTERFGDLRKALTAPDDLTPDLAVDKVRAIAEANPGSYAAQMALGQAIQGADPAGALKAYERATELVPMATGAESAYMQIVQLSMKAGDRARAARALEAQTTHDHTDVEAARQLTTLLDQPEDKERLQKALRRVVAVDPFDSAAHSTLGRMALDAGDLPTAVRDFRVALAAGPLDRASAHADLAEGLILTGAREEARKQTLAALEIAPTYERAQDLLLKLVDGGDPR
jgi:cellulose synthase operon protein C